MGNSWKTKNKIGISLCLDLVIQEVLAENNGNSWKTKNKIGISLCLDLVIQEVLTEDNGEFLEN
jgi:hypothetical protein